MPTQIPNFIMQNFRAPRPADVERDQYANAFARNDVQRIPQANRAQDLQIQSAEMGISDSQKQTAAGILANRFNALANSPNPRVAAQSFIGGPDFQAAGRLLGLPVEQFQITDQDTDDTIRSSAMDWARALGAGSTRGQSVQSTQVLEDGTIAYVMSDGQLIRTSEKARNDLRYVESGGGRGAFDPRTGAVDPITTATEETTAAADRAGAEAWARAAATAGVDLQKEQTSREGTLGVWRVAKEGLISGLSGTSTGPIAGLFPALTPGQQIADVAVASVAPVLKQLFRSAGEGVFTDRDQQLLLDMIPDRKSHPETIIAALNMIDLIIQAKLSAPTSIPTPTRAPPQGVPNLSPTTEFATEADAEAAAQSGTLRPGTRITIGGVSGVWQ